MRLRSVLTEAGRDLRTGASRAGIFALAVASTGAVLGLGDALGIERLIDEAAAYRSSGSAVWVTEAQGMVSGAACDRLVEIEGVTASGALRFSPEPVVFAPTPNADVARTSVTSGLLDVIDAGPIAPDGLVISEALAGRYALRPGETLPLIGPDGRVAGTFRYPSDGRRPGMENTVLVVEPAEGPFDQCWVEVWPTSETTTILTRTALRPGTDPANVRTVQLNGSLGRDFDGDDRFRSRATRPVPAIALAIGSIVGFVSVRARRLELASARHHGVRAMPQLAQLLVETAAWASAGAVCAAAVTQVTLMTRGSEAVGAFALRPAVASGAGAAIGAAVGVALVRERHLLRLFKER